MIAHAKTNENGMQTIATVVADTRRRNKNKMPDAKIPPKIPELRRSTIVLRISCP
ncbi:hypothetical protein D3C83_273480 [compost metagenome]